MCEEKIRTDREFLEKLAALADVTAMRGSVEKDGRSRRQMLVDQRRVLCYFALLTRRAIDDPELARELASAFSDFMDEYGGGLYYEALYTVLDVEHDVSGSLEGEPDPEDVEESVLDALDRVLDRTDMSKVEDAREQLQERLSTGGRKSQDNVMWG